MNILDEILRTKNSLPKKQLQLCNYILEHYQDIQITTVKTLAHNAGVGTTTVLRLVEQLGFDSYSDFKMQFYTLQNEYISKWDSVKSSFAEGSNAESNTSVEKIWNESITNLNESLNPQLIINFNQAIDTLMNAKRIFIFGARPYKAAAVYLELLLSEFKTDIFQLSNDSDSMFDRILQSTDTDVVLLFGFEPYTKRSISLARLAHENSLKVVLISDVLSNPISPYADVSVQLNVSSKYFSIIPIFALMESIALEIGKKTSNSSIDAIKKLVPKLREYDVIL
ncbi:MurR/RpiR family transcriptional regulator [Metasolibacillus sp. FSL H7-0170]|uniref:MurR/RpiR family transcriptional regulator n=1 Tax=Metasolibacillus sp. FSL H7-0170 TaxID=2921431 RepID=UPI0031591187